MNLSCAIPAILAASALTGAVMRPREALASSAQPPASAGPPGCPGGMEDARTHMQRGQALYAQDRYTDAAQEFVAAYLCAPYSAFLFNVGLAYLQAREWQRAVDYLRKYLQIEPDAPDREEVERRLREIEAVLPSVPTEGTPPETAPTMILITREASEDAQRRMKSLVSVRTVPEDARVSLVAADGTPIVAGSAPIAQTLSEGSYVLWADHPDYRTVEIPVSVGPGQVYVFHIEMSQGEFLGFLRVAGNVAGADVYLDAKEHGPVGAAPWGNVVPVGEHTVWVSRAGYVEERRTVRVEMGRETEIVVDLERVPYGELEVVTNVDSASIWIDGLPVGTARPGRSYGQGTSGFLGTLPAGEHVLVVSAEGMKDYSAEVEVGRGLRTRVLVRLNPTPSCTPAWVTFGVAGACIIAGGIFGGEALDLRDRLDADRAAGRQDDSDPRILEATLWAAGADASFAAGGVMAALGLYYLLRDPLPDSDGRHQEPVEFARIDGWTPAEETPNFRFSPAAGPGPAGIGLEVRF
ncbi:MAG: PEGA domain-containing protein [Myxococcota bacterium]|nr:PEGA domain-containing protein [Myxococcota bacterium]